MVHPVVASLSSLIKWADFHSPIEDEIKVAVSYDDLEARIYNETGLSSSVNPGVDGSMFSIEVVGHNIPWNDVAHRLSIVLGLEVDTFILYPPYCRFTVTKAMFEARISALTAKTPCQLFEPELMARSTSAVIIFESPPVLLLGSVGSVFHATDDLSVLTVTGRDGTVIIASRYSDNGYDVIVNPDRNIDHIPLRRATERLWRWGLATGWFTANDIGHSFDDAVSFCINQSDVEVIHRVFKNIGFDIDILLLE